MDKNEQSLRIKEFKNAMSERRYDDAANIADLIDVKKVDDNNLLSLIADAYELSHDYELAKEVLLLAYENTKAGRHLAYRLCLICIKTKDYENAEEFYNDFIIMAPKDTSRYVLQYKMAVARNESKDNLIKILEEYVNIDMEEKWAYELAELYKEVGDTRKCVELCDEIGLWFPGGKYLSKAMELKKSIAPLNITQQQMLEESASKEEIEELDEIDESSMSEAKPHQTDSIVQSIMDRQPAREEYKEPVEDILKEVGAENTVTLDLKKPEEKENTVTFDIKKPVGDEMTELNFEKPQQFDITEIKLAEPKINKNELLSARVSSDDGSKFDVFDSSAFKKEEDREVSIKKRDDIFVKADKLPEQEPDFIPNVKDVEDILQKLKDRGILGADTVDQAVSIIDNDPSYVNSIIEPDEEENKEPAQEADSAEEKITSTPKEEELYVEGHGAGHVTIEEEEIYTKEIEAGAIKKALEENIADNFEEATSEEEVELEEAVEDDIEEIVVEDPVTAEVEEEPEETQAEPEAEEKVDDEPKAEESTEEPEEDFGATRIMDDLGGTKIMEDLSVAATGVIPDKNSLKILGEKEQNAQVLEEAVVPIAEQDAEVPVLDLDMEMDTETDLGAPADIHIVPMPVLKAGTAYIEPIVSKEIVEETPIDELVIEPTEEAQDVSEEKIEEAPIDELVIKPAEEAVAEETPAEDDLAEGEVAPTIVMPDNLKEEIKKLEETKVKKEKKKKKVEKIENTSEIKIDLDKEDMEVFGNYLNVEGLEDNIKNVVLDLIKDYKQTGDSAKGNVIIVGDHQTGKTTMAIEIIKLVNKKRGRLNRRIAKIDSITFNSKDFGEVAKKLRRCDLIIEDAHLLEDGVVEKMLEGMKTQTDDMLVILEGDTKAMNEMVDTIPGMKDVFDHSINIKQYDIKEWVAFGKTYAEEKGYVFDELAELAFYKAIDDTFGKNKGISQEDVEAILEKAMSKCDKFKISGIFSSKKNDEGLKILEESNFN